MLITFRLTWGPLDVVLCDVSLRTMKPWFRWWSKAGVQQWDTCQEPTGLLWIGCLTGWMWIPRFKLGTSISNINSQTYWPKVISHVTNGTIFFNCSTSTISALSAALRISALLAAPKRWRRGCKNKKKKTGLLRNQSRRRWTWHQLSRQVPHPWTIRLRRKDRGYWKHLQGNLTRGQEEIQNFDAASSSSRKAERCIPWRVDGWSSGETCRDMKVRNYESFLNPNHVAIMRKKWQGNLLNP